MDLQEYKIKWVILGLLLGVICLLTLSVSPADINIMLSNVVSQVQWYSLLLHIVFLPIIVVGLLVKEKRNQIFSALIAFLALSASVASSLFMILPNIMIFALLFALILNAYRNGELNFEFKHSTKLDLLFGIVGLVFGFWYLHWVADPIWLNALLYSPLGTINCPTLVTICAFLILATPQRSKMLEVSISLITLYFGFFGILLLGAYIDVILIACGLYLLIRIVTTRSNTV